MTDFHPPVNDFAQRLIAWQKTHGRHDLPWQNTRDPYAIWVSEIMLQQTQVSAVIPYYRRFMVRFPDISSLAGAEEDHVLEHWSGLGYYTRARNLHAAAKQIMSLHEGCFPQDVELIEALPGIGRSTAAAIASFAFGQRHAIRVGQVIGLGESGPRLRVAALESKQVMATIGPLTIRQAAERVEPEVDPELVSVVLRYLRS